MSEDTQAVPTTLPEPSDARFSMRAMLIATGVVSLLAAIAGKLLQYYPQDVQTRLFAMWFAWLFAVVAVTGAQFWMRRRAEALAGRTRLRLPLASSSAHPFGFTWRAVFFPIFALVFLGFATERLLDTTVPSSGLNWISGAGFQFVFSVVVAAGVVPTLLWQREVRFCEHGILWNQRMLPWNQLREHRLIGSVENTLELYAIDAPSKNPLLAVLVAPNCRDDVLRILDIAAEHASALRSVDFPVGIDQLPAFDVLQTKYTRRQLLYGFISLATGVGLILYPWLNPIGIQDFATAGIFGLYLQLILLAWTRRRTARLGGTPLVRLFARRDWYGFVANIVAALILYGIAQWLVFPPRWVLYPFALAYGFLAIRVLCYYYYTQVELRSNGIVMPGVFFWPWAAVTIGCSVEDNSERRLIFRRGLRRIVALVPAEQRGSVERVLSEKLAHVAT